MYLRTGFATLLLVLGVEAAPTVTIKDGVVVGAASGGIDSFMGIPFAQPPTSSLRLKPPVPLQTSFGTLTATQPHPTACPQGYNPAFPKIGEDCLNLNVQRPSTATPSSKLPVLFFLYGGGFIGGANTILNGTYFVQKSMELNNSFIMVAPNYRMNGFGFLGGKELQAEGSTNLGLRDQRLAMQWVQNNIGAFGGDPTKVTLWGNSAGSISVMDHTIINGGDNTYNGKALFRGAMMSSGTILPALPVDSQRAQDVFNTLAKSAGCSSSSDVLACLRGVSYQKFLLSAFNVAKNLDYQSFDNVWLPRPDGASTFFQYSPEDAVVARKYVKVPLLIGDVEDEGTSFVHDMNVQNETQLISVLNKHFPVSSVDDIKAIVNAYPDDPAQGSPFRTGDANNIYPQYKRLAAIYGDSLFNLLRRGYLSVTSADMDTYSFLATFLWNTSVGGDQGTFHSTDVTILTYTNPGLLVPRDSLLTYYTSFINFLDPNKITSPPALYPFPTWNKWSPNGAAPYNMLNVSIGNVEPITDTYRGAGYQAIVSRLSKLKL